MTFVSIEVEVTYCSTVSNILIDVVHCVRLDTSGERDHTLIVLCLGVPDDTFDETLASANRIEVNLCGGGVESHGVPCFDSLNIHGLGVLCHNSGQLEECHTKGGPMTQPTILFLRPLVTGVTL